MAAQVPTPWFLYEAQMDRKHHAMFCTFVKQMAAKHAKYGWSNRTKWWHKLVGIGLFEHRLMVHYAIKMIRYSQNV